MLPDRAAGITSLANLQIVRRLQYRAPLASRNASSASDQWRSVIGAFFQRNFAGDAVRRQFVGAVVTDGGGMLAEDRERIFPAAVICKMRRQNQVLGWLAWRGPGAGLPPRSFQGRTRTTSSATAFGLRALHQFEAPWSTWSR